MVRIHPVPLRYLQEGSLQKFQWITAAKVRQHSSDPRPESLRVEPESIVLGDVIPSKRHEERRAFIESSPHFVQSIDNLVGLRRSALFCYEAKTSSGHRGELVRALKRKRDTLTVVDL